MRRPAPKTWRACRPTPRRSRGRGSQPSPSCRGARQGDDEPRAALRAVLRADGAAVQLDEMFDDGEAEPRAAGVARTRLVDAIEPLEHARQIVFRDAGPFVRDG